MIQYLASSAGELPDHEVARLIYAAQQRGVEVGKGQICNSSGEALQQRALGKSHTQDANHRMVVGSWGGQMWLSMKIKHGTWGITGGHASTFCQSRRTGENPKLEC